MKKNFYTMMTLDRAFSLWRASGKRNTFGSYCSMLMFFGYKLV